MFLTSCLIAQKDNIRFKRISKEQGLSQVSVNCILQDSKGFMWFGTQEGLNRYDGYEFKYYKNDPEDSTTISDNYIWCITEDKSGILWIGTNDGGLNSFDPATEKFTSYKHDKNNNDSLSHNYVKSICEDHEGVLWIGTLGGGLNKFDRKTGKFKTYSAEATDLSSNIVTSIIEDQSGTLWIGTDVGLNQYDPKTDGFIKIEDKPNNLSNNNIRSLLEDRSGDIWIGTQEGGLNKFDRKTGNFKHFPIKNKNVINHDNVSCLFEDSLEKIWIGTEGGGIYIHDKKTGKFSHAKHNPGIPHSLSNDVVYSIYEDKSGIVWLGTYSGGLNKYNPRSNQFALYQQYPGVKKTLSSSDIRAICEDRDGTLWIGTRGGGLNKIEKTGNDILYTTEDRSSNEDVRCIWEDQSGILWIGTRGSGLYKFDHKNEEFHAYKHDTEKEKSLSHNSVRAICEDKEGTLWIGTEGGGLNKLYDRNKGHFKRYLHNPKDVNSLSINIVFSIFEDSDGFLWVGTRIGGLNKFDPETEKFTHYTTENSNLSHNFVLSIYEDRNKNLWVGTYGGGLNKMIDREQKIFESYRKKDGLPNDVIYGILEDKQGNLWLSTNNGISKFNPKNETFKNYDVEDGLQSNAFNSGAYFKNSVGKMFFGGINGLNSFFPEKIMPNNFVPPVVITDFFIFNESVKPQPTGSPLKEVIHETEKITLSHEQNSFSFEFAALDYSSPQKNQYQYKLEGSKDSKYKDWKPADTKTRRATFINIPPGEYTFMVKGSNSDGIWNEKATSIEIIILRPWWKTWWAYALYFLAFIGFVSLLRAAWYKRFLKHKVEERTKELKNIQSQLVQSEKMRAMGDLVAGVAHEINNPASFVHTGTYNIARDLKKLKAFIVELAGDDVENEILAAFDEKFDTLFKHVSTIQEGTSRIRDIVRDLRTFTRFEKGEMKRVNLREGLQITLNLVRTKYKDHIEFDSKFWADPEIECSPAELNQVFMNILINACQAILQKQKNSKKKEKGILTVQTKEENNNVVILFNDTGVGMSEEVRQKIFDPFFTTKPVGEGMGLGLSVSFNIIEKHKGRLEVVSKKGKGTTIALYLPLANKEK
jgi:ligand-binding sensor domain-containing protein/signal transduction histidine kinase